MLRSDTFLRISEHTLGSPFSVPLRPDNELYHHHDATHRLLKA